MRPRIFGACRSPPIAVHPGSGVAKVSLPSPLSARPGRGRKWCLSVLSRLWVLESLDMADGDVPDYYELLQISPNAEAETIQRVYRLLASRYHPDNPNTGNMEMFIKLREAFEVLGDAERRAEYDEHLRLSQSKPLPIFELKDFVVGIEAEGNRRLGVLCLLYNRRRSQPDKASLSLLELEAITALPREHLEFTIWYLKEKGFLRRDEISSDYTITSEGVDWVESKTTSNRLVFRLLKSPEMNRQEEEGASGGQPS